jgi:DNA-binding transcriptional LysR family regulator
VLRSNLDDVFVFMAVVDAGSFVGGGKASGLTRSAAGKAVSRLEDQLGRRLLHRTTRTLSLTDEGRVFYEHGTRIFAAVDEAEASVAGDAGTPRGVLKLTAPDAFGRLVILPLLQAYLATWPRLQVDASFTDRQVDLVDEGFDLAIRIGSAPADSRLISRVITRFKPVLCASPSYLARHGTPKDAGSLEGHDALVFSSRGRRQAWRFRSADGTWGTLTGRSRLRLDSGEALREAALAGLGIALLPDFLVGADVKAGRLRPVLPRLHLGEGEVVALYPSKRLLEPRVRRFVDLMVEQLAR